MAADHCSSTSMCPCVCRSMYNLVDLVTFGIPLAASVNHLLLASKIIQEDHNIGLFSFSALFIFLHLVSSCV
ncbi:hypothetical protein EDD21DRAFT_386580 [Dissophora ornata]|nr:hypothetical protein EDD21DRAFT_386580 [Dissophora ornata]